MTEERRERLSPAMRRHLVELADAPYWNPVDAGEWAVARALARRGYLSRNPSRGQANYELTTAGRDYAASLSTQQKNDA